MKQYTIKEFAKAINVSPETVRRWDRSGKFPCTQRTKSGYRVYTEEDVINVLSDKKTHFVVSREFDTFKSSVCHHVKYDLKKWLLDTLESDAIEKYLSEGKPEYAYYTLAMLDKKLIELDSPIPDKYEWMRKTRLSVTYYPFSHTVLPIDLKTADPDFLKYNIVEGEIENVV